MANERCPSCGGAVRAGDPWCTLCWTDLRPKPAPPPAPVAPVRPPVPVAAAVAPVAVPAQGSAQGGVDPLTAPLAVLLGAPLAADPGAPSATWPCVECGEPNALDLDACGVCTAPFGGRIARLGDVKAARRRFLLLSLGAMLAFLTVLAIVTFAFTDTTAGGGDVPLEPTIDYTSLPREE